MKARYPKPYPPASNAEHARQLALRFEEAKQRFAQGTDAPVTPAQPLSVIKEEAAAQVAVPPSPPPKPIVPEDAADFLAFLQAGSFTAEQLNYLRSDALAKYKESVDTAPSDLGKQIIDAWFAALAANPPTQPPHDPWSAAP